MSSPYVINVQCIDQLPSLKVQLHRYGVLCIRGLGQLTGDQFDRLVTNHFINIREQIKTYSVSGSKYATEVSHDGMLGSDWMPLHRDIEGEASFLYNHHNGHTAITKFVDMAYPPQAIIDYVNSNNIQAFETSYAGFRDDPTMAMRVDRGPMVRDHRGTPVLMYSQTSTLIPDTIDRQPLDQLIESRPVIEHHWQPYDIVVWDNVRMIHGRTHCSKDRVMWRICTVYRK